MEPNASALLTFITHRVEVLGKLDIVVMHHRRSVFPIVDQFLPTNTSTTHDPRMCHTLKCVLDVKLEA